MEGGVLGAANGFAKGIAGTPISSLHVSVSIILSP
jgi:hypothetical protein